MFALTTRRSLWAPALVVVGVSVGIGAMLGIRSAAGSWPLWIGLVALVIAGVAWLDRRLQRTTEEEPDTPDAPEPERRRPRAATSGKVYDLEQDRSTDKQRYLM